jgi:hypothetical protein
MKTLPLAAVLFLVACDNDKAREAQAKAAEAATAAKAAAREEAGQVVTKAKEVGAVAVDKTKAVAAAAIEKSRELKAEASVKAVDLRAAAAEKAAAIAAAARGKGSAAVESFRTRLAGFHEWLATKDGAAGDLKNTDSVMKDIMANLKAIPTDGLPEDLKSGFGEYQNTLIEVQKLLATMPKAEGTALAEWETANKAAFESLNAKMAAAVKGLKEAAARHGIPDLPLGE